MDMVHTLPEFVDDEKLTVLIGDCSSKVYQIKDIIRKMIEKLEADEWRDEYILGLGMTVLYSHELEQLGKLMCLKWLKKQGPNEKGYPLREKLGKIWFNHDKKIKTALDFLPKECSEIWTDFESEGFNTNILPEENTKPNLLTRMEILHTDIFEDGTIPMFSPINVKKLKVVLEIFDKEEWKIDSLKV